MRETFEHKLGKLNNDLIRMGGMIEEAIASAIKKGSRRRQSGR